MLRVQENVNEIYITTGKQLIFHFISKLKEINSRHRKKKCRKRKSHIYVLKKLARIFAKTTCTRVNAGLPVRINPLGSLQQAYEDGVKYCSSYYAK